MPMLIKEKLSSRMKHKVAEISFSHTEKVQEGCPVQGVAL